MDKNNEKIKHLKKHYLVFKEKNKKKSEKCNQRVIKK